MNRDDWDGFLLILPYIVLMLGLIAFAIWILMVP